MCWKSSSHTSTHANRVGRNQLAPESLTNAKMRSLIFSWIRKWTRRRSKEDEKQSIQLCAALIFWNVVTTLESTHFLTRWLLSFNRLDWNNIKQMLAATRLLQAYNQHHLADDPEMIITGNMEIPPVSFDQDYPIVTERGEGSMADIAYNPQLHGDPLLHVQAFREPLGMKEQGMIRPMDHDQYLHWSKYYLFQEELGAMKVTRR